MMQLSSYSGKCAALYFTSFSVILLKQLKMFTFDITTLNISHKQPLSSQKKAKP
jgi:hypothetical protein